VEAMRGAMDATEEHLADARHEMARLSDEAARHVSGLASQIDAIQREHRAQVSLLGGEHELAVSELRQDRDVTVRRLGETMEAMRVESERRISELNEQLAVRLSERAELERRVVECEAALAKDKDERVQRLLDVQSNLEREVESLKAAIDIKNTDLFELRAKNNELTTKVDNYNELNMKLRRYKQEVEQLNAILKNKQESERYTHF
jgi:hypothetical protein